ncbi:MAG: hypothetical protein ACJA0S_001328 [Rickettsiales bacterium]|jgi:hypothetical protein
MNVRVLNKKKIMIPFYTKLGLIESFIGQKVPTNKSTLVDFERCCDKIKSRHTKKSSISFFEKSSKNIK